MKKLLLITIALLPFLSFSSNNKDEEGNNEFLFIVYEKKLKLDTDSSFYVFDNRLDTISFHEVDGDFIVMATDPYFEMDKDAYSSDLVYSINLEREYVRVITMSGWVFSINRDTHDVLAHKEGRESIVLEAKDIYQENFDITK
jgi:hypothetical protein